MHDMPQPKLNKDGQPMNDLERVIMACAVMGEKLDALLSTPKPDPSRN